MSKDIIEEIINKRGLFVVRAGPGSGKTTVVAKRLAHLLSNWKFDYRGIATISFTNVAWQEIEKYLSEESNIDIPISYPHFLGTIDSFINQYIFLPFGHLVMGIKQRPKLVGPPYNNWEPIGNGWYWGNRECNQNNCKLNDFFYDLDGNLNNFNPMSHFKKCESNHKENIHKYCKNQKKRFNEKGYATQLDANYFAMKILKKYPSIAKAISYRFPVFMIDEAQDTSKVQMRIIDLLIKNGLKEVMLIGDPDQCIYEWRNANPKLFEEKYKKWKRKSLELKYNYRSSQKICDFFSKISSFDKIIASNEKYKNFDFDPQIWGYNDQKYDDIIKKFLNLCKENNISLNPNDVAILTRSKDFLSSLKGSKVNKNGLNPWKDLNSENIAKSKYFFEQGNYKGSLRLLEKTVCSILKNKKFCKNEELESIIKEYGFIYWRKKIYNLIQLLPDTKKSKLGEWIKHSNEKLKNSKNIISDINVNFKLNIKRNSNKNKYSEMTLDEIFSKDEVKISNNKYTVGTVHSVKGETFEAVLLFVRKKSGNKEKYEDVLNSKIEDNEELRIIYVAITRPRKILVVAVPDEDKEIWENKFLTIENDRSV